MTAAPIGGFASEGLPRPRVSRLLRLAGRRRIVVVHGRAGCGKSLAVRQHLAGLRGLRAAFAVRSEHADVAMFARGLAEALAPVAPDIARLLPAAFSSARRHAKPSDTVATWLAEQLNGPMTIAIDQLHRIDDAATFDFIARLIDASRSHVRWILATRSTGALPLPRWLAAAEADASVDETALRVEAQDVADIAARVHGDAAFIESLRHLHCGNIGAIFDGVCGADTAWRRFATRGELLVALTALPEIDDDLLAQLPPEASALLDEIEIALPFAPVQRTAPHVRQLDESIRTRAFSIANSEGEGTVSRGRVVAARALESLDRIGPALQLYAAAGARGHVMRMLDRHGFDLNEHGAPDIVAAAIATLSIDERRGSAVALALEATDESFRGRYDVSEAWFEHAVRLAPNEQQRLHIEIAFAVDLLRRGRSDALERLEALARVATDVPHRVAIQASLAAAHASAGRLEDAQQHLALALAELPNVTDVTVRAATHQRAAFVALSAGDAEDAEAHADIAATLAQEHGNDELVAVTRSVSYVVAVSFKDDQQRALAALSRISTAGERVGNGLFRRFALIGAYLINTERCDGEALAALDEQLAGEEVEASLRHAEEGLLPARALQYTWTGQFGAAHQTVAGTAERQPSPETRALRWAEIAAYAAVANLDGEATTAITNARCELGAVGRRSVESLRATLLISLAALVVRRKRAAGVFLKAIAPELERWPRWRPFHALLLLMLAAQRDECNPEAMLGFLEEMHDAGLGGWARAIESIPQHRLLGAAGAR